MAPWRRHPLVAAACAALGLAAAGLLVFAPAPRPNILIISVDSLRADALGCYGGNGAATPVLDRLAEASVVFRAAYTPRGETAPSLATLLTGLNPSHHGVLRNDCRLPEDIATLPRLLAGAGYETAAFVANRVVTIAKLDRDFAYSRCTDEDGAPQWRWDEAAAAAAVAFIAAPRAGPFFAWVHLMDPHSPYQAGPEDRGRFAGATRIDGSREQLEALSRGAAPLEAEDLRGVRARYDEETAGSDRRIGRILAELEERGLASRTIVVVVADHGEELGERQRYFFHSLSVSRSVHRVPLLWRAPGGAPRSIDTPVSVADIAPALAAALALAFPHACDGVDLAPLAAGRALARDAVFTEYENAIAGVFTARHHFIHNPEGAALPIGAGAAAPFRVRVARAELYDIVSDPAERRNEAEALPEVRAELLRRIEAYLAGRRLREPERIIDATVRQRLEELGYL
ncbi:MAG TPA: sulfatase-like hydrolase/transferase [Planctomycetota bacterium]|nr:sulfatase-like hydrolase/transferase [Planctomycetota bacterium]OQC21021.1 MAG: Choline-sulfatase [Planctomycetes bacterium ADurb.Bin069]NMD34875.1 sulfatase-like hydrolase/transferase [Planctomycetota bacterium]HNR99411.1 sulfatase-like hydrolase/transferase [Planctomycetota bacterium]HNU25951.1 sulfatase-like hydrolase/transferase [Planctomycetota bacterium]